MILYVKRYEPPRRRLRIKNKLRMVLFLLLILCILMVFLIPEPDKGVGQTNYTPLQVRYGDTYWQIARDLQKQGYKAKDDIRRVVYELTQKSGIPAHELEEGDIIYIPSMGVGK